MSNIYVLDACAVIALIKKEEGWQPVFEVMKKSILGEATVFMHETNLLEVYYSFRKERGSEYAEQKIDEISAFATILKGFSKLVFIEAGRLKSKYRISLADSIALAEALILNGELLTCDHHEFDVIKNKEPINFMWIR